MLNFNFSIIAALEVPLFPLGVTQHNDGPKVKESGAREALLKMWHWA